MTNQSRALLQHGKKVFNDEIMQWRPGMPRFADAFARLVRDSPDVSMGGLQFGGSGGIEQLNPILTRDEYEEAKVRQAWPKEETMLDDTTFLDIKNVDVIRFKTVLRQLDAEEGRVLTEFGTGIVSQAGWDKAQLMMSVVETESMTHLYSWNSEAREAGFNANVAYASRHGLQIVTRIDPVGERMNETELGTLEETYILHKVAVVNGVAGLLVVTDLNSMWKFKDGTSAYNNMVATPVEFKTGPMGSQQIVVECEGRPAHDNRLTLKLVRKDVYVHRLGGQVFVENWPIKSRTHRTAASAQGETLQDMCVHANNMTHVGVLYMALTRGVTMQRIRLVGIGNRQQLLRKLKPHPKNLVLLAALGCDVPRHLVQEAIQAVLENEAKW